MVVDAAPVTPDYALLFRTYVERGVRLVLAAIRAERPPFAAETQEWALHTLRYSLEVVECWPDTRNLLLHLAPSIEQVGYLEEWQQYLEAGIQQSQLLGEAWAHASFAFYLGEYHQRRTHFTEAARLLEQSREAFHALQDAPGEGRALNRLAYIARWQRTFDQARRLAKQALGVLEKSDSERGYSYMVLATVALDRGNPLAARKHFEHSLTHWERAGDARLVGWGLTNLGTALWSLQEHDAALQAYQRACVLLERVKDWIDLAITQMNIGNLFLARTQPDEALSWYAKAESTFVAGHDLRRLAFLRVNQGIAHYHLQQFKQAEQRYRFSIQIWQQLGNLSEQINVMDGLGLAYREQRRYTEAIATFEQALVLLAQIHEDPLSPHLHKTLTDHLQGTRGRLTHSGG